MVDCPDCGGPVGVDDEEELDAGDVIECGECGALLRVTGVNPTELELDDEDEDDDDSYDEDEDDDDDEDEDEDDDDEEESDEDWK